MPSIDTSVALLVCQVREADCPAWIEFGLTEMEAVGAGGAGGGGVGGGIFFFPQALSASTAPSATMSRDHLILCCFTLFPPCDPRSLPPGSDEAYLLFPTPIGLGVASRKSQLLHLAAVGQHGPDFFFARAARLKHNMPAIGRPRRKIIPSAIVGQLHPLLAGDI